MLWGLYLKLSDSFTAKMSYSYFDARWKIVIVLISIISIRFVQYKTEYFSMPERLKTPKNKPLEILAQRVKQTSRVATIRF